MKGQAIQECLSLETYHWIGELSSTNAFKPTQYARSHTKDIYHDKIGGKGMEAPKKKWSAHKLL
jgi:hypothetical protein